MRWESRAQTLCLVVEGENQRVGFHQEAQMRLMESEVLVEDLCQ